MKTVFKLVEHFFRSSRFVPIFGILGAFPFFNTHASSICDYYRQNMPGLYKLSCKGTGGGKTSSATGSSVAADSFSNNPSGLPTAPSPYGLESIGSVLRRDPFGVGPSFSLIKGFHKVGAGLSTSANNTFFGNDIVQRKKGSSIYDTFSPHEPPKSKLPPLSAATSFSIVSPQSKKTVSITGGLSGRFNNVTATLGYGVGFMSSIGPLSFGAGLNLDKIASDLPWIRSYSAITGIRLILIDLEYTRLWNVFGYDLTPIHIVSGSIPIGPLLFTGARRKIEFVREGWVYQNHFAVQTRLSKRFTFALLYNYIPGATSAGLQTFF